MLRSALLLLALLASSVRAQTVRGVVREQQTGLVVPGTVVLSLDSSRLILSRTITNTRGEYMLPRAPTARLIRTLRLGFRPVELPLPVSAAPVVELDIRITAIPVTLDAVRTSAAAHCPKRKDAQQALALLEQVRAGLLATVVAREAKPAVVTRLAVTRTRDFFADTVKRMMVYADSAETTNSYSAALTANDFIETGFARDSAGVLTAYGPDAEVLLDAAFTNGYCFRLMDEQQSRPNQVGLGFAPARLESNRYDIDGALWVDTARRALVDIEFLYKGFHQVQERGRPGGHIEFRTMPNGVTLIERWSLRIPSSDAPDGERKKSIGLVPASTVIKEIGGELAHARWEDGTTWHAALGSVNLHLVTAGGVPDSGRIVVLDSTSYVGRTDAQGNLTLRDLAPGPYRVTLVDERLAQIGVGITTNAWFTSARDSVSMSMVTVTPLDFVKSICAADGSTLGSAAVIGRVLEPDGSPATKVDIDIDRVIEGKGMERVAERGQTGSSGLFRWCALEPHWYVVISAARGEARHTVDLTDLAPGLTVLQFKLRPNP